MTDETVKKPLSIYELAETDTIAEEDGRWFNDVLGPGSGVNVKLRRMTSKKSQAVLRRLQTEFRKFAKGGKLPDEITDKVIIAQLSEAVIVDWSGVIGKDGVAVPCTVENVTEIMTALPAFRLIVLQISIELDAFRIEATEDVVKN